MGITRKNEGECFREDKGKKKGKEGAVKSERYGRKRKGWKSKRGRKGKNLISLHTVVNSIIINSEAMTDFVIYHG